KPPVLHAKARAVKAKIVQIDERVAILRHGAPPHALLTAVYHSAARRVHGRPRRFAAGRLTIIRFRIIMALAALGEKGEPHMETRRAPAEGEALPAGGDFTGPLAEYNRLYKALDACYHRYARAQGISD